MDERASTPATITWTCERCRRELWQSRLPKDLVERGPRVVTGDGDPMWVCNDRGPGPERTARRGQVCRSSARSAAPASRTTASGSATRSCGWRTWTSTGCGPRSSTGPIPLTLSIPEPDLQTACYAAWNDWAIEEFNAFAPDRLCALPFLPSHSPEAAVAELERVAELGHRGAIIDVFDIDAGDPAWDRLWAAAEQTGLPLSFHIKEGASPRLSYQVGKWQSAAFATLLPLQLDEALAIMVFSGALERHPGLTLVLAEAGVGWLPYFLTRMDMEWENLRDKIDYAPAVAPERAVPASGHRHLRGGGAGRTSTSRTSAPTRACGRRTFPTPTARSPSRGAPSRRRWAMLPARGPPQDHRAQLRQAVRLRVCR